jgi:hypothetical protein
MAIRKVLSILFILSFSQFVLADVGIGVSADSNDREIYFPINFKDRYRVEPSIHVLHVESTHRGANDFAGIGVGLFRKNKVADQVSVLIGARLGYSNYDQEILWPDERTYGYSFAPTLAVEYAVNKKFSR